MGDVKIVGSNWLCEVDSSGRRSVHEASVLGAKISIPVFGFLGFAIGIINFSAAIPGERLMALIPPIVGMLVLGAVLGAAIGSFFGMVALSVDTPEWAEPEYGNNLRMGAYLLLLQGDGTLFDKAKRTIAFARPTSVRILESHD